MSFRKGFNQSIIIAILFLAVFFFFQYQINVPLDKDNSQETIFLVSSGESLTDAAKNLKRESLIKNKFYFILYVLSQGAEESIQAGEYSLSSRMSIKEIAAKIIIGEVATITITIPEGINIKEIENILDSKFQFGRTGPKIQDFKIRDFKDEFFAFLDDSSRESSLEGFLFPDTYIFPLNIAPNKIAEVMLDNFDRKLTPDLRGEIQRQNKTIHEIITMASLVEKEVRTEQDMKLASGIFWKRLEIGMPLQVDATITYLTGKKTTEVTFDDLKIDSPYNTYLYKGLPPGPIANPGIQAIKAAIYPQQSDYLYYLSKPAAKGEPRPNGRDGETVFSKTFDEHIRAKAKFLR